jgi:hypothetical protein
MFRNLLNDDTLGLYNRFHPGASAGQQQGPNGGPYAGVAPTLAGANAGYGGAVQSGANPMAAATPLNPYVAAARQASGT